MAYRTAPEETPNMPGGVPHIIVNEAAERFSFYGMKTILVVFMTQYLWLMDDRAGAAMTQVQANQVFHSFSAWVYLTPLLGAFLSDLWLGKYRTIMALSIVYCLGHAALACMGMWGDSAHWFHAGLILIALGAGGIKPCVSAHVGDQFGSQNQQLLVRVYNWFYFSINLGSFISTIATPWMLKWYGPHWAFGIPGVLMLLATIVFWMGRQRFAHIPAQPLAFWREFASREGLFSLLKLTPLVLFVAVFWALFDQTGSSWIFQAADMNRHFLGIHWLESQIQAINPILILTFIPLFSYLIYPAIDRHWKLTALRKIGLGLFLTVIAYSIPALVQSWISQGQAPSIAWHLLAYVLLTMAEVMVSIVCIEFFYTQAPRRMKSVVMAFYWSSVFLGNLIVNQISHSIEIPTPLNKTATQAEIQLLGFDGQAGTKDDLTVHYRDQAFSHLTYASKSQFEVAASRLETQYPNSWPQVAQGQSLIADLRDAFGNPIHYELLNQETIRLRSAGPDHQDKTLWDLGIQIQRLVQKSETHPETRLTWLEQRQLDHIERTSKPISVAATSSNFVRTDFVGGSSGMTRLEGSNYFWFFTILMLITAVLYLPFSLWYRPRHYLPH